MDTVTYPPYLTPGSVIGITCPSGYVSQERIAYAVTVLEHWGYRVKIGRTVGNGTNYFAGTDAERAHDLQEMLDDEEIGAILMGRGGYGMSRILDHLDFTHFADHPKWLCGFSDITSLLCHIQVHYGIASLHSPMCGHFRPDTKHADFLTAINQLLCGEAVTYPIPVHTHNVDGEGEGLLVGGNLSLLVHLTGSVSEIITRNCILFIEDLDEHLYHIDRMLLHLKRAGKLDELQGLVVGGFTDMKDTDRPFGQSLEEIVLDKVQEYGYPVCFGFPAGHQDINYPLIIGAPHKLNVSASSVSLSHIHGTPGTHTA